MQILGKRSKVLLIAVAIVMLIAVGVSFAVWDTSAVKATNGDLSSYANAKVGDIIEFGKYYQTGKKDETTGEYEKTPIEWLVVDKDERTGQLTLMSKYILAAGSYFGNWYYNTEGSGDHHYNKLKIENAGIPYNQAYVDSTVRAFLNNLERRDLGGDSYSIADGFKTSAVASDSSTGKLLTSVGYSNKIYTINGATFQRPITNVEYINRPATRGFYDEAFTNKEKSIIIPKSLSGYTGYRWPNNVHETSNMSYVEGAVDKIWIPSATELNIMDTNDGYTNPSDEAGSTVFKYFEGLSGETLQNALKTTRTPFVINDSKAMNFSIPLYKYQSTEINDDINTLTNSLDFFWTRSPSSRYYSTVLYVTNKGTFVNYSSFNSDVGVRPCVILKY